MKCFVDSRLNVSSSESEMLDLYYSTVREHPNFVSLIVTTIVKEDGRNRNESQFSPYLITVSGTYDKQLSQQEMDSALSVTNLRY